MSFVSWRAFHLLTSIMLGGLHVWWQSSLISFVPLVLTWPLLVSWTYINPLPWLLVFSQVAELFSTTPPGVMTLVVLAPYGLKRVLFRHTSHGFSWRFAGVLAFSGLAAFLLLLTPQILLDGFFVQPWLVWGSVLAASITLVFGVSLVWHELRPAGHG